MVNSIVDSFLPSIGRILYQVPGGMKLTQWCHNTSALWSILDMPLIPSRLRIFVFLTLLDCEGLVAYLVLDSVTLFDHLMMVFALNAIIDVVRLGIITTT